MRTSDRTLPPWFLVELDKDGKQGGLTFWCHSPTLRGAQVFSGIAGIIGESQNQEDVGSQSPPVLVQWDFCGIV